MPHDRSFAFRRFSCITAVAAGLLLAGSTRAQEEGAGDVKAPPRDVAAVDDAMNGWWSDALKTRDQRIEWFREARFGCFIHWGVYADLAGEYEGKRGGGYSEHIMRQMKIPLAVYKEKVVANFNPDQFNADEWAALIKSAGMKYVVITSKHHDGFAMWPSDAYPYDIRQTKFKRDPMQELSEATRKAGLKFGFYYSHAFDWEHPDAPGNDWDYENPNGDRKLHGPAAYNDPTWYAKAEKYVDEKAIPQLKELIAKYHPDILWFDVSGKLPFALQVKIVKAVRLADPKVLINGRAARGMGKNFGDYLDTADRPAEVRPTAGDWECIPTCNESYGYHKLDNSYKPPVHFVQLLAKCAAKGGNVLLNIGPMGSGKIDPNSTKILQGIGQWMSVNGQSIWATQRTPLDRQSWGDSTVKGDMLYLHVFDWPRDGRLIVGGLKNAVSSAFILSDGQKSQLKSRRMNENDLAIDLPPITPDAMDTVIALKVDGAIQATPGRLLGSNVADNRFIAFDGELHGRGFKFGDGKTNRYWVAGFTSPSQTISWKTRLNEPGEFDVSLKYSTTSAKQTGSYQVKIGEQALEGKVNPTSKTEDMQTVKLGRVKLAAGSSELQIMPVKVEGDDLMNLFEVSLTPVR